ncbi:DUF3841 domain-containing protein [Oscillibacter sp.]|uniref:DUF3841 domain-containing protein n=1 Tax=Oscillibacter sp. TaxID=1945593 RepID=UPI0028A1BD9F|nr:DUF3841 domain-containing protein [Oscillibacter sp.]
MEHDRITLWTRQDSMVLETMDKEGIYRVYSAYVDGKYQESGWSFQIAYGFFRQEMSRYLAPELGEESPIWLHGTQEATGIFSESPLLKLEIPWDECVFFDQREWNRVLNLEYLGRAPRKEAAFQQKLEQQGVAHASIVFRTPHYPLLKKEILDSWRGLVKREPMEAEYLQAAVWHLKKEWLTEIS